MADPIELVKWWHAMVTSVNGDRINKIAADFNAIAEPTKQDHPGVQGGSYAETSR